MVKCLNDCCSHCLPRWPLPLQRRDAARSAAVGITADEVEAVLRGCHSCMWDKLVDPTYALDRPRIHTSVRWEELGQGPHPIEAAPQPRYSPDFNRPIEHFHSALKKRFSDLLITYTGPKTVDGYFQLLWQAFNSCWQPDSAMKDVLGLRELWLRVASEGPQQGAAGNWPPRRFR